MSTQHTPPIRGAARRADGFTLVETIIALGLLAIVAAGVLPMAFIATQTTENQGHLVARTTEYAQDKLEQLMALNYGDQITDTRVFPALPNGGSGLTVGGSIVPTVPVAAYVDYLDEQGNVLASANGAPPANWFYQRVWRVTLERADLKRIAVLARVRASAAGGAGLVPQATVAALKTNLRMP